MKNRFQRFMFLVRNNWKSIILFETIYRIIGVVVIFPLGNQLLYLSVRLTGSSYISNLNLINYMLRPSTIIIFFIFALFLALYTLFEITALSILFHVSQTGQTIGMKTLIVTSFYRLQTVIKRKHIVILLSTLVFFILVEGFHIAGIASTVKLPRIIVNEFETVQVLRYIVFVFIGFLLVFFIQTLFFELISVLQGNSIKESFKEQEKILKNNRLILLIEFIVLNALLNLLLYGLYLSVLGIASGIAGIFVDSSAVFGILLSIMYIIYLIIGFLATILLMPINFAWINSWYYNYHPVTDTSFFHDPPKQSIKIKPSLKRIALTIIILLLGVNVILIRDQIISPSTPIQLLNNPRVIAHRGSSEQAPENTLSAIEKAIYDGADAVEIDVRLSKDGVPILMHDSTLKRTTNDTLGRKVSETSFADIRLLDAGSWFDSSFEDEAVPTLEEALLAARGRVRVYVELKNIPVTEVPMIIEIIENTNMSYFVKILSFNEDILSVVKEENSNLQTILLISAFLGDVKRLSALDFIDAIGIRYQLIQNNRSYVTTIRQEGKEVYVYTVNTKELIQEMDMFGVNGIITDVPILTREVVYEDTTNDAFQRIIKTLFFRNQ